MFGFNKVEDLPLETWWDGQYPYGYLRAPIGKTSATTELIFDLNDKDGAHGPHGLIGGMTGSGKSEALKTLILALAMTHHPYDINFALVDYKGGAAFNDLAELPHTVGIVTDIESHASYAERVILALAGENEQRKRILENARGAFNFGRSHVDEYRELSVKRPLPRLVIVFDEFAEFKQRHPEESKRLISIARVGRSLGVHLILATQNIQAAIDPQILQNSTFRICLKVSEAQDSIQMIGIPDAIGLTRGRAYFSSKGRKLFQSAWAGAPYGEQTQKQTLPKSVVRIWPDGRQEEIDIPRQNMGSGKTVTPDSTQAYAVIRRINEITQKLNLKTPPPIWLSHYPHAYISLILQEHTSGGWLGNKWKPCRLENTSESDEAIVHPIIGLYDNRRSKSRSFINKPCARNGHLLIFGAASSVKAPCSEHWRQFGADSHTQRSSHLRHGFWGQSTLRALEPPSCWRSRDALRDRAG